MRAWLLTLTAILVGATVGIGAFTFVYAKGYSYLTTDPAACANCHVMNDHFGSWLKSSHRSAATCNDCHTPPDPVGKYYVKARNGFFHSLYFTTGNFPYPLRITEPNRHVVESACRHCHGRVTLAIDHGLEADDPGALSCARCHKNVGHWVR